VARSTLLSALLPLLAAAGIAQASGGGAHVRLVHHLWGVGEVQVVEGGHPRSLERFAEPQSVKASETSGDGRFAFVWHRGSRPGLRLGIYDLRSASKTAEFAPGFGGDLHFTPGDNLVHSWGCGTNCANFAVYDPRGRRLLADVSSGVDISPSRRFVVTYPSLFASTEPVVLYDADSARVVFESARSLEGSFLVDELRWDEPRQTVEVRCTDALGESRRLRIEPDSAGRLRGSFPDGLPRRR
jgi:hypothetical protein